MQGLGKRFSYIPAGLEPPIVPRIRKSKIRRGGGICAPSAKHGNAPAILIIL